MKVGQEVAWNMSFVEQMGPEINEKYMSNLMTYQKRQEKMRANNRDDEEVTPELNSSERYAVGNLCSDHTAGCMDSGEERAERYDDREATAAGVHHKSDERFNLAGDFTWRKINRSDEIR